MWRRCWHCIVAIFSTMTKTHGYCRCGKVLAPGFTVVDLGREWEPEGENQQGRSWSPAGPGGAKVRLLATAARGDVSLVVTGE